ncbi:RagB/SusD family nutrient uptake outer membrane protein [Flagellimonas onchidii]|uniref:RagB/SusD family nutrient uptake outer membrane protein n=1 Tax=Flagellimonas onchidii TaxID=2562684 RepID=UPI0010A68611|nr:RagB/SusD family nutrient uptake outer membrane protein [Allomuricauda onchidii]
MKKNNVLTVLASLILLVSCSDDFLDKQPFGVTASDEFFANEQDALLAINGAYEELSKFKHGGRNEINAFDATGLMWSGNVQEHPDLTSYFGVVRDFLIDPEDDLTNHNWWRGYVGIQRANQVIQNVPGIEDIDTGLRDRIIGEAYFLRALYYHYMVMWYGGVPIVDRLLDPGNEADFVIPRSTKEETLALAKSDLEKAETMLPTSYSNDDLGRATRGAAKALLLKVLLWQQDYPAALAKAQEIEGMGYALVDEYTSLFDGTNENSTESVFEIQFAAAGGQETGSSLSLIYGPNGEGMVPNGGWGFVRPLPDLVNEFEDGDSRKAATLFEPGDTFTRNNGDVITFEDRVGGTGFGVRKYVTDPPDGATVGINYAPQNFHEIRYAEVILLYAEALLRNNQKDAAVAQINRVRARPSVDLPAHDPGTLTDQQAWEALYHEYRVELALEARFGYALRRWGIAAEWYASKAGVDGNLASFENFTPGKDEVLPIPQRQIDFSVGTLDQNPGH